MSGLFARLFGNPKKEVPVAKGYDGSLLQNQMESTLRQVELNSQLLVIMGKWLVFFGRLEMLREAMALLTKREVNYLADYFPEFIKKDD